MPPSTTTTTERKAMPPSDKAKASKVDITSQPVTLGNWYKHVNWLNMTLIAGLPLAGLVAAASTPLNPYTIAWAIIYYYGTGLGITAGYHRLWAHTSYSATLPLRVFLALLGAGSVEGSIRWWARDHRAHHRYTVCSLSPVSLGPHRY